MRKIVFLVPLLDNEGQPMATSDWDWLVDQLVDRFGGWTLEGRVEGAWRDAKTGQVYRDASSRYSVVVEDTAGQDVLSFLGEVKIRFRQLALYVESPTVEVTFL